MNREEAYKEMMLGKRVTHKYFLPGEYCTIFRDKIYTEDGYLFNDSFWNKDYFESGWSIY